jgi:hypothetical protein
MEMEGTRKTGCGNQKRGHIGYPTPRKRNGNDTDKELEKNT